MKLNEYKLRDSFTLKEIAVLPKDLIDEIMKKSLEERKIFFQSLDKKLLRIDSIRKNRK